MKLVVKEADYNLKRDADALVRLTDMYARDPMGMEEPLPNTSRIRLPEMLRNHSNAFSILAYLDGHAVGVANCFVTLSTFEAKPIVNIHDLAVDPDYRGNGFGRKILDTIFEKANQMDCCRITLEVRKDNPARELYKSYGFRDGVPPMLFMTLDLM